MDKGISFLSMEKFACLRAIFGITFNNKNIKVDDRAE